MRCPIFPFKNVRPFGGSTVRQFGNDRTTGTHGTAVHTHRRGVGAPNSRTLFSARQRSFSVVRAITCNTKDTIQNRTMILGSGNPFSS